MSILDEPPQYENTPEGQWEEKANKQKIAREGNPPPLATRVLVDGLLCSPTYQDNETTIRLLMHAKEVITNEEADALMAQGE